jgi:hypothetical protein
MGIGCFIPRLYNDYRVALVPGRFTKTTPATLIALFQSRIGQIKSCRILLVVTRSDAGDTPARPLGISTASASIGTLTGRSAIGICSALGYAGLAVTDGAVLVFTTFNTLLTA